ncbi:EscU/YscU/HrcU family type III secretion system export apparatus switch protein [Myxococcota bacterium]|nr:EscU/YscU/HrcU family type III secretion system export apparatus switch protein [Myxococcota bacterium]
MGDSKQPERNTRSKRLVGLSYEPGEGPPKVMLKASERHAEEILRIRRQGGTEGPALVKNPELVQALYRLPIDAPIGRDLFSVVAAVLVHVFAVDATISEARDA